MEAVRRSGYTPNGAARNLRTRRTMTVLVVAPRLTNPVFAQVLRGVDDELTQSGYGIIVGNLDNQTEREVRFAGLICYYDRARFHYLTVSADDEGRRVLQVISCLGNYPDSLMTYMLDGDLPLPTDGPIHLGVDVYLADLQFRWSVDGASWSAVGPILDASILSDEAGPGAHGAFTGAFLSEWLRMI